MLAVEAIVAQWDSGGGQPQSSVTHPRSWSSRLRAGSEARTKEKRTTAVPSARSSPANRTEVQMAMEEKERGGEGLECKGEKFERRSRRV